MSSVLRHSEPLSNKHLTSRHIYSIVKGLLCVVGVLESVVCGVLMILPLSTKCKTESLVLGTVWP